MSTGTDIYYNETTLTNVHTKRFEETTVYDETGTEVAYQKFTIRVVGYCFTNTVGVTAAIGVSTNSTSKTAATSQRELRAALMEPRKNFIMTLNGNMLLSATPNSGKKDPPWGDINNGPKPQSCTITQIAGANILRVEWEIEICLLECRNNKNDSGVLYNRWAMQDTLDEDFYTTRTLTGKMRVLPGLNPQDFRKLVLPVLQSGFQRKSIVLTTSPDGLLLEYTVTDVEMFAAPPYPATNWEGTHTVSTNDGVGVTVEMVLRLTGAKNVPKKDLIEVGVQICYSRCDFLGQGGTTTNSRVIQGISIVDHLQNNSIEIRMAIQQFPVVKLSDYAKQIGFGEFLRPADATDYKREQWPIPKEYGTATPTGLLLCYLQSPCNAQHAIPDYGNAGNKNKIKAGTKSVTYEGPVHDKPYISDGIYNQRGDTEGIYTYYQIDSKYETNEHKIGMPIASSSSASDTDSQAFITLARPCTRRVIRIAAERYGNWPDMPSASKTLNLGDGVTATLLKSELNPKAPQLSPDATSRLYSIDAVYVYGLNKPITALSKITTGRLPWLSGDLNSTALTPSSLVSGLA